ncbi:MAG: M20/M25/M40 family metallo-hydrolase [Cyclobacteriaceae bacterium]
MRLSSTLLRLAFISCLIITFSFGGLSTDTQAQELTPAKIESLTSGYLRPAIEALRSFVAIPNDAVSEPDIQKNIDWAEEAFQGRGFETSMLETPSLPIFLAERIIPGNTQTVLFYFHLDGQPIKPAEWQQPDPYQVVLRAISEQGEYQNLDWKTLQTEIDDEWRLFGRSAADDKAPIIMLLTAMDILQASGENPPYNIKVMLDTEEEKGSSGLKASIDEYKERFQADYMIVMDGPMHSSNRPTLTFGCRGGSGVTITTYGPVTPQHSGHFGNYAPNPAFRLARLVASMKDAGGRVLIPGFYDGITLDAEARAIMDAVPDDEAAINDRLQIAEAENVGNSYQEALQFPSLNIRGMQAAVVGQKSGTIIPEKAVATFDIRLVPETDGDRMVSLVRTFIEDQGYTVVDHEPTKEERLKYNELVYFQGGAGSPAFRTGIDTPMGRWLREALTESYEEEPVMIRIMGGTVPVVPIIKALDVPAIIVPLVNQDNNQHSPNENLRIGNLRNGIKTCLAILKAPIEY